MCFLLRITSSIRYRNCKKCLDHASTSVGWMDHCYDTFILHKIITILPCRCSVFVCVCVCVNKKYVNYHVIFPVYVSFNNFVFVHILCSKILSYLEVQSVSKVALVYHGLPGLLILWHVFSSGSSMSSSMYTTCLIMALLITWYSHLSLS
jgi:hypothetical protein